MAAFDMSEIKSPKGLLKLFQALINLIAAIFSFVSVYSWTSQNNFFEFVAMTGFFLDLILLAMAFVKISSKIKFMPYIELTLDGIWILFYLIAANIIIKHVKWSWTLVISVFCGYVAMITYFIDALLVFKKSQFSNSTQPDGTESAGSWVTDAPKPRY